MTAKELQNIKSKINYLVDDVDYHLEIVSKLRKQIKELKENIAAHCDHTSYQSFEWVYNSGYGKLNTVTGIRCLHCGKENAWGRPEGLWDYPD